MDIRQESLEKHYQWKGKIRVESATPVKDSKALSLAYTPGVAEPCLEIQKDINKSYELTRRWNLVAVITDGTAVLGLGDIGPEAGIGSSVQTAQSAPSSASARPVPAAAS